MASRVPFWRLRLRGVSDSAALMDGHSRTAFANPTPGHMAWRSSRNMKSVSRHRLRRSLLFGPLWLKWVAPGKKRLSGVDQRFDQKRRQEFPHQPGLGSSRIVLRQMIERNNAFQPLKDQFHLPASPIDLQQVRGGDVAGGQPGSPCPGPAAPARTCAPRSGCSTRRTAPAPLKLQNL